MTVIQTFWHGCPLGELQIISLKSYVSNGCIVHLYAYDDIDVTIENVIKMDAREILPISALYTYKNGSISAFSNTFRFSLLYQKGGIWSDMDVVCTKPFDMKQSIAISSEKRPDGSIQPTTHFLKMPKKSLIAYECLKLTQTFKKDVVDGKIQWGIGPRVMNEIISKYNIKGTLLNPLQTSLCGPLDYKMLFTDESKIVPDQNIVVHMWQEMWRTESIHPTKSSFYKTIKQKYM